MIYVLGLLSERYDKWHRITGNIGNESKEDTEEITEGCRYAYNII